MKLDRILRGVSSELCMASIFIHSLHSTYQVGIQPLASIAWFINTVTEFACCESSLKPE